MDVLLSSNDKNEFQVYYSWKDGEFSEKYSDKTNYKKANKVDSLSFKLNSSITNIRLDLGNHPSKIDITNIVLRTPLKAHYISLNSIVAKGANQVKDLMINKTISLETTGGDPYIYIPVSDHLRETIKQENQALEQYITLLVSFLFAVIVYMVVIKRKKAINYFRDLRNSKALILELAKNDFKTKYAGSYLGVVWGYIQPIVTIVVYWFVFQVGLRVSPADSSIPFALWFISGLIPWFFFSDALSNATNSFVEYSFLVKKVVFKVSILPFVKLISSFYVHLVFILFLFIVYFSYGENFHIYNLQVIYYTLCTFMLVAAISYLTSCIVVFLKDLGQFIVIILQVGMWITPIMWSEDILSDRYRWIFKLNPMYYVVKGYRDSLFEKVWFFEHIYLTMYFWFFVFVFFVIGGIAFKRLKPHFADVL
jgi:ABC-type polysaccharide/polyol phosphate export systems, permease component